MPKIYGGPLPPLDRLSRERIDFCGFAGINFNFKII
jgi:hypothetical protein